ncbi:MAG: hypothetical protein K6E50_13965 [Lachnospiraceae bacterium]|nr:hypothetical protein [Lachnospiraceae bacterium]
MAKKTPDRREYRRKRRIRNQILCWLLVVLMLALIVFGAYEGIKFMGKQKASKPAQEPSVSEDATESAPEENGETIKTPESMEELTEEIEPEVEEEEEQEDPRVLALLEGMSLEQKIDGLFLVSPETITGVEAATMAGDGTKDALMKYAVGGILYASKNVSAASQFEEMVATTRNMYHEIYNRDLLTLVDEEGAQSTIAAVTEDEQQSPESELGVSGSRDNVKDAYAKIGETVSAYHLEGDMAPVAAVKTVENAYLGNRIFSDDADMAASMVSAAVEGLSGKGMLSCLNAFPGEGGAENDPERNAISTDKDMEALKECELKPFIEGIAAGADMVMVSNIVASNAGSGDASCSLSEEMVTGVLRRELGFEGVIVTAPLDQAACTEKDHPGNAALKAFLAGADLICIRNQTGFLEARETLLNAVNDGTISEELVDDSLKRIYRMELRIK